MNEFILLKVFRLSIAADDAANLFLKWTLLLDQL